MAFNEEYLKSKLEEENTSVDDKIKSIMSEYEADVNGLKLNRDDILNQLKKEKEQNAAYKNSESEYQKKIEQLMEEVKKKSSEDNKKFYETQLAEKQAEFDKINAELKNALSEMKEKESRRVLQDDIDEATADMKFISDVMKKAFILTCMQNNKFEEREIDGKLVHINQDNKSVKQVFNEFALSSVGKEFIACGNSGGGAKGSSSSGLTDGGIKNPWKPGQVNLGEQMRIYKENKELAIRLAAEHGVKLK